MQLGAWLAYNGEAIFATRPWTGALPSGGEPAGAKADDMTVFYTVAKSMQTVFAMFTKMPSAQETLKVPKATSSTKCFFLAKNGRKPIKCEPTGDKGITLDFSTITFADIDLNCPGCAWTVAFEGLATN